MSIHNDSRQFGTDEERTEWQNELRMEYAKEEWENVHEELPTCEDCFYYDKKDWCPKNGYCDDFKEWREEE